MGILSLPLGRTGPDSTVQYSKVPVPSPNKQKSVHGGFYVHEVEH